MIEAVTAVCVFVWVVSRLHRRNAPPSLDSLGSGPATLYLLPRGAIQRGRSVP